MSKQKHHQIDLSSKVDNGIYQTNRQNILNKGNPNMVKQLTSQDPKKDSQDRITNFNVNSDYLQDNEINTDINNINQSKPKQKSRILSAVKNGGISSQDDFFDKYYQDQENASIERKNKRDIEQKKSFNLNILTANRFEDGPETDLGMELAYKSEDSACGMTPGLKQIKYQGLGLKNCKKFDIQDVDEDEQDTIDKMNEMSVNRNSATPNQRNKPQSAYAGGRVNRNNNNFKRQQSRGKIDNLSQIPNELLEAANIENGILDDIDGDNKTENISIDDVTNDDNELEDDENVTNNAGINDSNLEGIDIQINQKNSNNKNIKLLIPNKKLSNIFEKTGENDNESVGKKEELLHVDEASDELNEDKKAPEKKQGNGLDDITPEELERLKQIMGPNFTLNETKIEGPDDFLPSRMIGKDVDYSIKNRVAKLQDREAQRVKANEDEYLKGTARENLTNRNKSNEPFEEETEDQRIDRLLQEEIENGFDPSELKESYDGWEFYKRKKINQNLVKRYCATLDQDYTKFKITICCHLNHIFDLYIHQRRPFMRTLAAQMEKQQRSMMQRAYHQRYYGQNEYGKVSSQQNSSFQCVNNAICSQCPEDHEMSDEERQKAYNKQYGQFNPNLSNQLIASPNYYKYLSDGIQYYKKEEENHNSVYRDDSAQNTRAIKRLYINFDKDVAPRMFGYRVRFVEDQVKSYAGQGAPSVFADQSHKPLVTKTKELIFALQSKYIKMEDYQTRQTIVKMLDSDDEADQAEIEKNKKIFRFNQRSGTNQVNFNPKLRKTNRILKWHYDKFDSRFSNDDNQGGQSPLKRRFPQHKRFVSNNLRDSNHLLFKDRNSGPLASKSLAGSGVGVGPVGGAEVPDMNPAYQVNYQEPLSACLPPSMNLQPNQYFGQIQLAKGAQICNQPLQNSESQLTREKIEMQRSFLIEQLSRYPQAYNAYLMMSGLSSTQINSTQLNHGRTGVNQIEKQIQLVNQILPTSSSALAGGNMQKKSLSMAAGGISTEKSIQLPQSGNWGSFPADNNAKFQQAQAQFQHVYNENGVQSADQSIIGSNTNSPSNKIINKNPSQVVFAQTSNGGQKWANRLNRVKFQPPQNEYIDPEKPGSATKSSSKNIHSQGTNGNFMSNQSKSSQRSSINGKKYSNSGHKSQGSYISRVDKTQNPNYQYSSFASLTSTDQIMMTNNQSGKSSQKQSRKNLNSQQTTMTDSKKRQVEPTQILPQGDFRGIYGNQGDDVNIQKLIQKNKAIENAIHMQNLQMQYIEQMKNMHLQQQVQQPQNMRMSNNYGQQESLFQNKNRVDQYMSAQVDPRQSLVGTNSLLSGGNKNHTGRTLQKAQNPSSSIQSKSTHYGGSNTANSNTESNTNSNGEKEKGFSRPAVSNSQNFEATCQGIQNKVNIGAITDIGQHISTMDGLRSSYPKATTIKKSLIQSLNLPLQNGQDTPDENEPKQAIQSPEYGQSTPQPNIQQDFEAGLVSNNSIVRTSKPSSCFTPGCDSMPSFIQQQQRRGTKWNSNAIPDSLRVSTDEYAERFSHFRENSIKSNERRESNNCSVLSKTNRNRNALTGVAQSHVAHIEKHTAPSNRQYHLTGRQQNAQMSQNSQFPSYERKYPGSGYTSVLGHTQGVGAKGSIGRESHIPDLVSINLSNSRANTNNLVLGKTTQSLSPVKNSISQNNGQMILNLNNNVMHSLVQSSNAKNYNIKTNVVSGEMFQSPLRSSVLSSNNNYASGERHSPIMHKQTTSFTIQELPVEERSNQAILSKNFPLHSSRLTHLSQMVENDAKNNFLTQNPKSNQVSPQKQIKIENDISLSLGIGGPSNQNGSTVFGMQQLKAQKPNQNNKSFW